MVNSRDPIFTLGYIRGSRLLPRLFYSIQPPLCYIHFMVSVIYFHVGGFSIF